MLSTGREGPGRTRRPQRSVSSEADTGFGTCTYSKTSAVFCALQPPLSAALTEAGVSQYLHRRSQPRNRTKTCRSPIQSPSPCMDEKISCMAACFSRAPPSRTDDHEPCDPLIIQNSYLNYKGIRGKELLQHDYGTDRWGIRFLEQESDSRTYRIWPELQFVSLDKQKWMRYFRLK